MQLLYILNIEKNTTIVFVSFLFFKFLFLLFAFIEYKTLSINRKDLSYTIRQLNNRKIY